MNALHPIVAAAALSASCAAFCATVAQCGGIRVECAAPGEWRFSLSESENKGGIAVYRLVCESQQEMKPPRFTVECFRPAVEMQHRWTPVFGWSIRAEPDWASWYSVNRTMPLVSRFADDQTNRETVAVGEARKDLTVTSGFDEHKFGPVDRFSFFCGVENVCQRYSVDIRIDRRMVFWSEAVEDAAGWIDSKCGLPPVPAPPESVWKPLYSTWYAHHHAIDCGKLLEELGIAASLGMKTAIIDAGWQMGDDDAPPYSVTGDWNPEPSKFPDMAAHVADVHALGIKYILWCSVPFAGYGTEAHNRFVGKFLYSDDRRRTSCFDPRFPEVRDYIAGKLADIARKYGFDGFKVDFVEQFETRAYGGDPAVKENFSGRDCRTVPEGVEKLVAEISGRVRAVRPEVMFEFRDPYFGPVMRRYGTMFRVADCPGSLRRNLSGIVNLRLVCRGSCVHGDMIRWADGETPEMAARYVLSSILGTVQYSAALGGLGERHLAMLRHWIAFSKKHEDALQRGNLRPYAPQNGYPAILSSYGGENVLLISSGDFAASVPESGKTYALNNTGSGCMTLKCTKDFTCRFFDTFGEAAGETLVPAGISEVRIPVSGYAILEQKEVK